MLHSGMVSTPNRSFYQAFACIPGWLRNSSATTPSEATFASGAALAILDARARAESNPEPTPEAKSKAPGKARDQAVRAPAGGRALVPAGAWRCRLALTAAATSAKIIRRGEDEAMLRDAFLLRHGSADPGPAGRLFSTWRNLDRSAPLGDDALFYVASLLGLGVDDALKAAITEVQKSAGVTDTGKEGPQDIAPVAAAQAASLVMKHRPDAEIFSLLVADAVLAVRLKWPRPVPLLATALLDGSLRSADRSRRPHPLDDDWTAGCCAAYAIAAVTACDLFDDLAHRSQKLLSVSSRLRAKGAATVVEKLHHEDAVAGSQPMEKISGRALRRLFDRLVALEAVRELTGRLTFRLYGL